MSHLFEHLTILPKKIIQVHWEKVIYLTSVFQMAPPAQSKSHQWFLEHAGGRLLDLPEKREKREKKTKRKKKERKKEEKRRRKRRGKVRISITPLITHSFSLPSPLSMLAA